MLTKQKLARKLIHVSSVFVIFYDVFISHETTVYSLFILILFLFFSELFTKKENRIPILSDMLDYCAYDQEKESFPYAPLLSIISIFILITFFKGTPAYVGIVALSLGDGLSGLVGMQTGSTKLFYKKDKSLEGSIALLIVTFFGSFIFLQDVLISLAVSLVSAFVESVSDEVIDNFTVPFTAAFLVILLS